MKMKKLVSLLCVTAMVLGLAACGSKSETPSSDDQTKTEKKESTGDKDTLVFISHMTSETLDPLTTASATGVDKNVMHQIFNCLLQFDDEGKPIPCLAESWEDTDDGHAVLFHLRDDVKFHDGTPFNADAVVYTFDKQFANPLTSYVTTYYTACEKVDDYTVKITKATPHVALLPMMAESPWIVSPTAYEKGADEFAKNPVGTGAYKFESQGADQYVHLVANEDYFEGAPYFKKVTIRTPMDSSTAVVALQNNEADIAINVTPNQLALVEEDPNLVAEVNTGWSIKYLNFYAEPFTSDENLRKAVYYAINRENAAMFNNEPETIPATTLYPQRVMGDYADLQTIDGYDVDKAKEYLAQSNYNGETLKLYISANEASIAQSVQGDLQAIGINVEIVQLDTNAYYAKFTDGTCQMSILDFGTDQVSTEDMLNFYVSNGYYGEFVTKTPEYDELMAKIDSEYDAEARKELVKQALEMQYSFYNMVPMYESYFNFVHRAELTGFNPVSGANYVYYLGKVKPAE
ncbi:ABC transporter substrate-binding protein [Roseburia hominis]